MLKKYVSICAVFFCAAALFSYNPPRGGESLFSLTSPLVLSGGLSAAGGPLFNTPPETIAINPALTAYEQRVAANLYTTVLSSFGAGSSGYGQTAQIGLAIPTKWGVFTGLGQGIFSNLEALPLGNTFTIRGGFSKDIAGLFAVGAAVDVGFGSSWALNLNLGIFQNIGSLGFLKDFRWGVSLTGMGKPFKSANAGIYGKTGGFYPSLFTPHAGVAATLVSVKNLELGASLDLSLPAFQNGIFAVGLAVKFFDIITVNTGWSANVRELMETGGYVYPSLAISARIEVNSKKNAFLEKQGWQKSDIIPEAAYQRLDGGINAISAGATVYFGLKDTEAPIILLEEIK